MGWRRWVCAALCRVELLTKVREDFTVSGEGPHYVGLTKLPISSYDIYL